MIDIIAFIIIGILLVIILSLFIPLNLYVKIDEKINYIFEFKFLFFKFTFDSKQTDKAQGSPKTKKDGIGLRAVKKLFGIDSFETKTKKGKPKSVSENINQIINTLKSYLSSIGWLLRKIKIKKLSLKSVSASSDAAVTAMQYGTMCALLYPFFAFLKSSTFIDENAVSINVACDFEKQQSQFEFESEISLKIIFALRAVVDIIRKNI